MMRIPQLFKSEISSLKPSSVAVQPGLCRKPECWFSHDEAQVHVINRPMQYTVKLKIFRMLENFAVTTLKFRKICSKGADGMANSEDPDQTDPLRAI